MSGLTSPWKAKMKRVLPNVPKINNKLDENSRSHLTPTAKTVTFNAEIIETSIGGTETFGHIKCDPLSPCDGCGYHNSKTDNKSLNIHPENEMKKGSDKEANNAESEETTSSEVGLKDTTTVKNGLSSNGNDLSERRSASSRPKSENNEPKTDPAKFNECPDVSTPTSTSTTRRLKNIPRSKVMSCGAITELSPDTSLSNKANNLMNLSPMGDSPTKIPILSRRANQSYPDGHQNGTPVRENSASYSSKALTPQTSVPSLFARTSHLTLIPNGTPVRRHTLDKLPLTPECYNHVHLDMYRPRLGSNDSLMDVDEMAEFQEDEGSCSVTVAVRVRPFSQRELSDGNVRCVVGMSGNQTTITSDNGQTHQFHYDFSFWSFDEEHGDFSDQENVYGSLARPLLGKAFEGYNTCLFAYGQTGSGKSYSIMGHGSEVGIIPRFSEELFAQIETTTAEQPVKMNVEISFFEIYNEKIHDLLASSKDKSGKKALRVREHPVLGPYVEGLSTFVVNSFDDIQGWITLGNKSRATAATGMNDKSSRSHSVFTLVLTQTRAEFLEGQNHDHSITSKINLVDLAGSERQSQAQTSGERLREGANINKSLMTLGKVISVLCERSTNKRKKLFIPYRDSVLTWLLKESLGGNSKTAMIATISPANHHTEETLSTLRYAKQARNIVNNVRVNEDPKARLIRELRSEIDKLRCQTGVTSEMAQASSVAEIATLKKKLASKEKEMEEASRSWKDKLQRSVARKEEELKTLEKAGVSFKVDNKLPNLVNLNEDPQLSEMLLYVIKEGQTKVGRLMDTSTHDIQLTGALIADDHCVIINEKETVSLVPNGDAPTYVNGNLVTETCVLHHGDRVILGGDHYFRFNHPTEVQRQKKSNSGAEIKDFEFAKQEVMRVQESRLQAELEEAKRLAQEEMTVELEKIKKEAEEEFNAQKSGYEGKLANLKSSLKTQQEKAEEDAKVIDKLKKQLLEQEVLAGKKRQQMEFEKVSVTNYEVNPQRSKLLDLLQSERDKFKKRLDELKQKRAEDQKRMEMPSPSKKLKVSTSELGKTDLYKTALLLSEANRIGQHLRKHTTFSRVDVVEGEEMKTYVQVTNTKLNICTYWPLSKFEEKLLSMRELYQGDGDNSAVDEVFYDPTDTWEKENGFNSPRNSRSSLSSSRSRRMSLLGTHVSTNGRRSSSASQRAERAESVTDSTPMSSVFAATRTMMKLAVNRVKGDGGQSRSIADEVLLAAESLKLSTCALRDSPLALRGAVTDTSDPSSAPRHVIQMPVSYQVLQSLASLWSSLYQAVDSPLILDLTEKISGLVKELGNHIELFLQGCENEIESMLQESGTKILHTLYDLCKNCGELALATDTPMTTLNCGEDHSGEEDSTKLCSKIRQSFIGGCDVFVDKTLQGGIKTLEECELKSQTYTEEVGKTSAMLRVIPVHVEVVMATACDLLEKCQEIQVELDISMMDTSETKPPQFYQHSYSRSQRLVSNISCLVDAVNLIMQATESVIQGSDTDLRKIIRCSDMIHKSAVKLFSVSKMDSLVGRPPSRDSSQSDLLDVSVLSDQQLDQLAGFVQEVKVAANTLSEKVQEVIDSDLSSSNASKGKRTLPASPGAERVFISVPVLQGKNRTLWNSAALVGGQK